MSHGLQLDFLGRRRPARAGWAALVLAAALAGWQGWLAWQDAARLQQQQAALGAMRKPPAGAGNRMSAVDIARHAQVEALARYLATPWSRLLDLFESHARRGITLVRFTPDAATGQLEITGRAASVAAVSEYLLALERDPRLTDVQLRSHEKLADAQALPVEFTLVAAWGRATTVGAAP